MGCVTIAEPTAIAPSALTGPTALTAGRASPVTTAPVIIETVPAMTVERPTAVCPQPVTRNAQLSPMKVTAVDPKGITQHVHHATQRMIAHNGVRTISVSTNGVRRHAAVTIPSARMAHVVKMVTAMHKGLWLKTVPASLRPSTGKANDVLVMMIAAGATTVEIAV